MVLFIIMFVFLLWIRTKTTIWVAVCSASAIIKLRCKLSHWWINCRTRYIKTGYCEFHFITLLVNVRVTLEAMVSQIPSISQYRNTNMRTRCFKAPPCWKNSRRWNSENKMQKIPNSRECWIWTENVWVIECFKQMDECCSCI